MGYMRVYTSPVSHLRVTGDCFPNRRVPCRCSKESGDQLEGRRIVQAL